MITRRLVRIGPSHIGACSILLLAACGKKSADAAPDSAAAAVPAPTPSQADSMIHSDSIARPDSMIEPRPMPPREPATPQPMPPRETAPGVKKPQ